MAFGQSAGPPATGRQVKQLLELLAAEGYSDFRDARGPMGFNQRQAGGKFTRDEADALIEHLEAEADGAAPAPAPAASSKVVPAKSRDAKPRPAKPRAAKERSSKIVPRKASSSDAPSALADVPSEELAAELQRRGWAVMEP